MREIKFRAWDGRHLRLDVTGFEHGEQNEMAGIFLNGDYYEIVESVECKTCNQAVVMQYTGIKDKNGVEIYEGDLVKYKPYENIGHCSLFRTDSVEWGETGDSDGYSHGKHYEWVCGDDSLADAADSDYGSHDCEVVGNIYENPELLGGDNA